MKENELGQLGIHRIPVPIPFAEAGGPVNAYAIEEERGLLLFDPGIGTGEGLAALANGFARIGRRFDEISRIVLSHGHIDHFGAASWVLDQAGRDIPILIHPADADKVLESSTDWPELLMQNRGSLMQLGLPALALEDIVAHLRGSPDMGRRLKYVTPLSPCTRLACKHVTLEVLHMPGHTPGTCCLYEREHRLLFSADHLLEKVSPNPLIELRPMGPAFRPLVSYFKSLERVRALAIDLVLPGHAAPFGSCLEVINSFAAFYGRRQAKLLEALRGGPLTVYQAMQHLFAPSRTFELFLMMSETLGNLEMLEHRGEVERDAGGTCTLFKIAGTP